MFFGFKLAAKKKREHEEAIYPTVCAIFAVAAAARLSEILQWKMCFFELICTL